MNRLYLRKNDIKTSLDALFNYLITFSNRCSEKIVHSIFMLSISVIWHPKFSKEFHTFFVKTKIEIKLFTRHESRFFLYQKETHRGVIT